MSHADRAEILVVDDMPGNVRVLAHLLETEDLEVVTAHSGKQALELACRHDFALAMVDVAMPGMDGFETAARLRELPGFRHVPVIFMTTLCAARDQVFQGYEAGAVDYLVKPVEPAVLRNKVRVFVEQHRVRKTLEMRVAERVEDLREANARLLAEVRERQKVEARLREALAEKESLLAEIHHRVKNNLQIVSSLTDMVSRRIQDPEARAICLDLQAKIHGMGLIHTELYRSGNIGRIDIAAYGRTLFFQLAKMYEADGIEPVFDLDEVLLPLDKAVPCGLILNELLSNVFKHAYPKGGRGQVDIRIGRCGPRTAVISIRDHGRGLPEEVDGRGTTTFGLRLIRDTVKRQLCGTLRMDRGEGTAVAVEFQVAEVSS